MPNSSKLAQIRAQYNAQQEALNARRRKAIAHLIDSPVAHWSGVRQDVLTVLRANRDAINAAEGAYAPVQPVNNRQFYFRHNAPQVGSLVEHDLFGLGMVEGKPFACANTGMALAVFFDEIDRSANIFVDELQLLDGDLVGNATDYDSTTASDDRKARVDEGRRLAAESKYNDADDTDDDAAFEAFMADEFAAEFGDDDTDDTEG